MTVYVKGASATRFGELWNSSPRVLARTAAGDALRDAGVDKRAVEALFVGNMLSGMLGRQEHLGAFFSDELGISCPACKVEGACASGGLAMHTAALSIVSGQYKTVLVLGIEKMTDHKPEEIASALMGAGSEEERMAGATFPGLYAMLARTHMMEYGTTEEECMSVAVKNHFHGSRNPKAHFQRVLTLEKGMKSTCIADPLKLYDCSPVSDGAAAVVLSSEHTAGNSGVQIRASCVATDSLGLAQRKSLTTLQATHDASTQAYVRAGIEPKDIHVAEVHDCFTIAEVLAMEDLGFYPKGHAARAIMNGETTLGTSRQLVVNPSGGLKACGHPVGATGVKQIVELYDQLSGRCKDRQVDNATCGLAHNVGGSGATAVVHILQANKKRK